MIYDNNRNRIERMKETMGREENVLVFQDTEKLCKTNSTLKDALNKSIQSQKLILETQTLPEV